MKRHHWIGAVVLLIVGYGLGVFFPSFGARFKGMIGGSGQGG